MKFMIELNTEYAEGKIQMQLNKNDIRRNFGSTTKNIAVFWDVMPCHLASGC